MISLRFPLILASASPRRSHLLRQIGLEFSVHPSEVDESFFSVTEADPSHYVQLLAETKALNVASKLTEPSIVLGADTIVVLDGLILGKPTDREDAMRMLKGLSGRTHTVYTGIALVDSSSEHTSVATAQTEVTFRDLDEEEIIGYIAGGSPMDKAGAYGIQDDYGAVFVSHIVGCYYNIVGLPLELLYRELMGF
ncbi:MAG: septum formation inhibitor Maf [Ignavibacteriae bacterium]|nr:septum formation inhibitor Maf [Ignavibacteriota bacterium]